MNRFTTNIAATLTKPYNASVTSLNSNHSSTKSYKKKLKNQSTIKVNVSGRVFELSKAQVKEYPDSLLANEEDLKRFYEPTLEMYYFDRNRALFEYIVQFYQTERDKVFKFPEDNNNNYYYPPDMIERELDFFKIGWREMSDKVEVVEPVEELTTGYQGFMDKGHRFLNDPSYCIQSKIYMIVDITMIIVSILQFILETEPLIIDSLAESADLRKFNLSLTWAGTVFFVSDFLLRLIFAKSKIRFFIEFATWLDAVALVPFFIDLVSYYSPAGNTNAGVYKVLKVLRTARLARCFKIIRHSKQLLIIITILQSCASELSMMLFAWLIGVLLSGSFCYFAETSLLEMINNTTNPQFSSILEGSWWAVVTISTTGYGDIIPQYGLGIAISTIIIFSSAIFMAIPMTIIIRKFSESYENIASEEKVYQVFGREDFKVSVNDLIKENNNCSGIVDEAYVIRLVNNFPADDTESCNKNNGDINDDDIIQRKNCRRLSL